MACYAPLTGYFSKEVNPATGRRPLVFTLAASFSGQPVRVPCGQCVGCRLERARQWGIRCMHEKRVSEFSCFITLTYDDKHLPEYGSLVRRDPQLFLKRLRKKWGTGVKYFGCGEYGERSQRPHYHLLLFNMDFPDKKFLKNSGDNKLYFSKGLEELWPQGQNVIGDVTFESAVYCAKYCCDKYNGIKSKNPEIRRRAELHYTKITSDGEIVVMVPEFPMYSLKPGIGQRWFDKYHGEAYAHDSVIMNGKEVRPPRFYDKKFELVDAAALDVLKSKRRAKARLSRDEQTPERRRVREQVTLLNLRRNKRDKPCT